MTEPGNELSGMLAEASTIVCCGSGGVGKTTVAAAIALEGARRGRRTCVVTIDPARRLADALGIATLTNTPSRISGDWGGELWGMMLDSKGTFDDLVHRYAADDAQAQAILDNRLYRNISEVVSGTQEYMAMEKLYELHDEARFDLIVVDTPPTRNALDFIDAPKRLTRFLDNRIFRVLMMPTRASLRAVSLATQAFLRTISRVVGADVVKDTVAFFQAFEGMEEGFRDRANRVYELLSDDGTRFALVASPRADAMAEAEFFAEKLEESSIPVRALVMNRMHPRFLDPGSPLASTRLRDEGRAPTEPSESLVEAGHLALLRANLADFEAIAGREEAHALQLATRLENSALVLVPFLDEDVHDIAGLEIVAHHLFGATRGPLRPEPAIPEE